MAIELKGERIWDKITDADFENERNIDEDDLAQYDLEKMKIFSANINYFRQILRLSDSLKPVERRLLYTMYLSKALPGTKTQKSNRIVGNAMQYHAHGDCLRGNTNFVLTNGEVKTIKELYDEYIINEKGLKENNDEEYPYQSSLLIPVLSVLANVSILANGTVMPNYITDIRIGQYTKKIYHIHLKNGGCIQCTNNHPIMIRSGHRLLWVKAENLKVGDKIYAQEVRKRNPEDEFIFNIITNAKNTITDIIVEELEEEEPMYDFTSVNLLAQNALIVTYQDNYKMEFACVHNSSIYKSLVGMSQVWKRPVPLIQGKGNFGNDAFPESYAHSRYTEATLSKYAYECFFEDYDEDCVETIFNTAIDGPEPLSLPAKFPNILVNGGVGIAVGNAFRIPPYNINDIISLCKRLINNPDHPDIYMVPDLPTGCSIIDPGDGFKEMCETGTGTLTMRADIEIIEKPKKWVLKVRDIPWMTSLRTIEDKLEELTRKNILPIKDIQNESEQIKLKDGSLRTIIDYRIIIDKSHDPYVVRNKLYKLTDLEKAVGINFKVVLAGLSIGQLSMRELVLSWIDERREYKRRLLNKKIVKLNSRISLLEILIKLLDKDNINKTVNIIKNSNSSELVHRLREHGNMSSFQASKIAEMRLNAFTKDARERYIEEKKKLEKELEEVMDLIKSEKKIDKIIIGELEDLRKYGSPRKSQLIAPETGRQVAKTNHIIVTTKQGYIKKLPANNDGKSYSLGAFKNYDYPTNRIEINNLDSIILFDSLGKFTRMPVYEIDNTEINNGGNKVYDVTKLDGEIVSVFPDFNPTTEKYIKDNLNTDITLVTLSKDGYLKKTKLEEYTKLKNTKNIRAVKLKDNDSLIYANIIMDTSNVLIYTKKGKYVFIKASDIALQSKDSMGLLSIQLEDGDECVGLSVIGDNDEYLLVVTEKGNMKKCEIEFMGNAGKRKVSTSYISSLDPTDNVIFVSGVKNDSKVIVCNRNNYNTYEVDMIPTLTRRAKGQKMIPVPVGDNIISVVVK